MLVQLRHDGSLWCMTQHDHARISGRLAHEWKGLGDEAERLSWELVLATTLHDQPWVDEDQTPRWNPDTRQPYSFLDLPGEQRIPLYSEGLERLEEVDPYAAMLVSLHYCALAGMRSAEAFQAQEGLRRERLRRQMELEGGDDAPRWQQELVYLQLFDLLSLALCLKTPAARPVGIPRWLLPENMAYTPAQQSFAMSWAGPDHVRWQPYPWHEPMELVVPYRCLPAQTFPDEAALLRSWAQAEHRLWRVRWTP